MQLSSIVILQPFRLVFEGNGLGCPFYFNEKCEKVYFG
jgi:hypothetical protein